MKPTYWAGIACIGSASLSLFGFASAGIANNLPGNRGFQVVGGLVAMGATYAVITIIELCCASEDGSRQPFLMMAGVVLPLYVFVPLFLVNGFGVGYVAAFAAAGGALLGTILVVLPVLGYLASASYRRERAQRDLAVLEREAFGP